MTARYRIDPEHSRLTVQAFASGFLSFLGHSPTFAARRLSGEMGFEGDAVASLRLLLTVPGEGLELVDKVSASDREEIEGRMRREVLETAACPEVRFQAAAVSADRVGQGHYRVRLAGSLALHGVTRDLQAAAELLILDEGLRLRGECPLRMSEYRIKPVTALAGAIKLKDEIKVSFDMAAVPAEP